MRENDLKRGSVENKNANYMSTILCAFVFNSFFFHSNHPTIFFNHEF